MQFDYIKFLDLNEKPVELRGSQFDCLINKTNFYEFTKVDPIESHYLKVCSVHVTKDVQLNEPVHDFLSKLAKVPFAKYEVRYYSTNAKCIEGKRTGLVVKSKNRKSGGSNVYLTLYDKFTQSRNEKYKGVLRLEMKLSTFRNIRQRLNIVHNTLHEVLHSKTDPIQNLLQTIYSNIEQNQNAKIMTNELRLKKAHAWFTTFNYEWESIKNDLLTSNATSSQIKTVKQEFIEVSRLKNDLNYSELFSKITGVKHHTQPTPNAHSHNQLTLIP